MQRATWPPLPSPYTFGIGHTGKPSKSCATYQSEYSALGFQFYLYRGDAVSSASNFEVHVSVVVLRALQICQDRVTSDVNPFCGRIERHESHCVTKYGAK